MYRGADGAAGDIGHIRVGGHDTPVCRCGNVACLEALAGGAALARQLKAEDYDVHTGRDVVRLSRGGDPPRCGSSAKPDGSWERSLQA